MRQHHHHALVSSTRRLVPSLSALTLIHFPLQNPHRFRAKITFTYIIVYAYITLACDPGRVHCRSTLKAGRWRECAWLASPCYVHCDETAGAGAGVSWRGAGERRWGGGRPGGRRRRRRPAGGGQGGRERRGHPTRTHSHSLYSLHFNVLGNLVVARSWAVVQVLMTLYQP